VQVEHGVVQVVARQQRRLVLLEPQPPLRRSLEPASVAMLPGKLPVQHHSEVVVLASERVALLMNPISTYQKGARKDVLG